MKRYSISYDSKQESIAGDWCSSADVAVLEDRIRELEAALREIASHQGHDSALDINAKHMRDTAREALGSDMETACGKEEGQ